METLPKGANCPMEKISNIINAGTINASNVINVFFSNLLIFSINRNNAYLDVPAALKASLTAIAN